MTGEIDTDDIVSILNTFIWSDLKCVEVLLRDGRRTNMKEEEVRQYQPMLYL